MRGVEQIPWLYDAVCAAFEAFGLARWRRWLVAGARGRVAMVMRNMAIYATKSLSVWVAFRGGRWTGIDAF